MGRTFQAGGKNKGKGLRQDLAWQVHLKNNKVGELELRGQEGG